MLPDACALAFVVPLLTAVAAPAVEGEPPLDTTRLVLLLHFDEATPPLRDTSRASSRHG